jgi:hypothetical protein
MIYGDIPRVDQKRVKSTGTPIGASAGPAGFVYARIEVKAIEAGSLSRVFVEEAVKNFDMIL